MSKKIKLSQCMIVKNEEKNIKRALTWAKNIVFEQIVVDTGSTDKTVKIAREMGAKVFNFEWIDDFSAAKNFAIEQATGDWIAFLDADEYLNEDHANKILQYVNKHSEKDILRTSIINLNDMGSVISVAVQDRFFRNHPSVRYHGRIHENLVKLGGKKMTGVDLTKEIFIYHTGYTREVYENTNKLKRNIDLLREELQKNPENFELWAYLGESLYANSQLEEAEECLEKTLNGSVPKDISYARYEAAQTNYLRIAIDQHKAEDIVLQRAKMAGYPDTCNLNIVYFMGVYYFKTKQDEKAFREFEIYMNRTQQESKKTENVNTFGDFKKICVWMTELSRRLKRPQKVIYYGVLALRFDKYLDGVLSAMLECFLEEKIECENAEGTYGFLQKLYDFENKKDLYFLYKCARLTDFFSLQDKLMSHFTVVEQRELRWGIEKNYIEIEGIPANNEINKAFLKLIEECQNYGNDEWKEKIISRLEKMKQLSEKLFDKYEEYHNQYQFWGTLKLEENDYDSINKRVTLINEHLEDFIWLYKKLSDYRSKKTLFAILQNWIYVDTKLLKYVKENQKYYFDLDLIPSVKGEVFVDVGTGTGGTISDFVEAYDRSYKKIYAYEFLKENWEKLERNMLGYEHVSIFEKSTFLVDEDIDEPITWIKVDANGKEEDVLLTARNHIINDRPKLSIAIDHGYDELWKIPKLIWDMNSEYEFYLRYYGDNLIATKYVLTAIPK